MCLRSCSEAATTVSYPHPIGTPACGPEPVAVPVVEHLQQVAPAGIVEHGPGPQSPIVSVSILASLLEQLS
jgi:hypothetical protein